MDKIAVLIPCYNEAQTIRAVIEDYRFHLPDAVLYVYDNNSTDDTAAIARACGAVVRSERRQGKGNVIRAMFQDINAQCYLMVDGDNTYPAVSAPEMVRLVLEEGADMVIGDRLSSTYFTENDRRFHNSGNVLVRNMVNSLFRGDVTDIMTGLRAFSALFAKSFPVLSKGFEIETEMTIHALDKNLQMRTIPVDYKNRPEGSVSKLNTFRDGFRVLSTIFRLFKNYKPLAFFSVIALILALIGLGFFIPILIEFIRTGLVPRMPTLLFSIFTWLVGVMSLTCGFILDTITQQKRQQFEIELNIIKMMLQQEQQWATKASEPAYS